MKDKTVIVERFQCFQPRSHVRCINYYIQIFTQKALLDLQNHQSRENSHFPLTINGYWSKNSSDYRFTTRMP